MVRCRPARPAVRLLFQRQRQSLQNPVKITHHILIGEPDCSVAMGTPNVRIPFPVILSSVRVAVDFDDQPFGRAKEIHDTVIKDRLTAELVPCKSATSQLLPKADFRFSHGFAQFGRAFEHSLAMASTTPNPLL